MRTWKKQNPDSYCHLQFDKLYIDNRLYVWDKESGEVRMSDYGFEGGHGQLIFSFRLLNKRATQSQERQAQTPALPPVFLGGTLTDWTVTLEIRRSELDLHIQAKQTELKPDQTFKFPTQLLSHDQVGHHCCSKAHSVKYFQKLNVSGLRRMPVFRDHVVFACQGDSYIQTKIQENTGTTSEILPCILVNLK